MLSSSIRTGSGRLLKGVARHSKVTSTASSSRFLSTERIQELQAQGILGEDGLTKFDTLHEMNVRACQTFADNELFGTYQESSDSFEFMTYQEYAEQVEKCRAVLKDLGIGEFDKVAVISNNRWEWATLAAAAFSMNASLVPMYEAQLPSDWIYILNDSGASAVFCATQDIYVRVQKEVLANTPTVKASLCLDAPEGQPHAFQTAMAAVTPDKEGSLIVAPTPEDLANLIYTSGTTGKPKGVELTHDNFSTNVKAAGRSMMENPRDLVDEDDRSLAFLPWAHSYGQTCELWMSMSMGASMGVCRGVPSILEDLQLVKPTALFSVPTLYKRIYDGVHNLMENANPVRKSLMRSALQVGDQQAQYRNGNRGPLGTVDQMKFSVLDKLVLSKVRDRFGGNLRHGFVAGSACPAEVLKFMDAIGVPVCEGYGLTETSPIITINVPGQRSVGSVGRAIGGVTALIVDEEGKELPIGEEGEICCFGPNVMKGYHNKPEATEEVISVAPDGKSRMFHTGDLGRLDEDGWLRVTGRKKEQYKLENGKYVVPTPVENAIGMSRFISQLVLCGANRPFNTILIVPELNTIREELKIGDDMSDEEMAEDDRVKALIDQEIKDGSVNLKKFEIPQKWAFVAPFTAANDMLTPKMSIKRHNVMQSYEDVIAHMYGEEPIVAASADGAQKEAA